MNKFPFTATQWQELEHQALIFKYMVSGIPIPPDLLFAVKRSFLDHHHHHPNTSPTKPLLISQPHHVGAWNCFQMGLGRKIDPEPGRCRRTDGKKWRCSKEAFPDSKYCERHMHRGKNRSRKPVEVLKTTPTTTTTTTSSSSSSILTNSLPPKNDTNNNLQLYYPPCLNNNNNNNNVNVAVDQNNHTVPSFVYRTSSSSSSSRPPNGVIMTDTSLLFDSDVRKSRYVYGVKEEVDEHAFFSEEPNSRRASLREFSSGGGGGGASSMMDDSWRLTPLTISCSQTHHHDHDHVHDYYYSHNNNGDNSKQDHRVECDRRREDDQSQTHHDQKTIHFFDEWPMKQKDSWLDLDDKSSNTTTATAGPVSSTHLSISMPKSSHHDFPIFTSRTRHGD